MPVLLDYLSDLLDETLILTFQLCFQDKNQLLKFLRPLCLSLHRNRNRLSMQANSLRIVLRSINSTSHSSLPTHIFRLIKVVIIDHDLARIHDILFFGFLSNKDRVFLTVLMYFYLHFFISLEQILDNLVHMSFLRDELLQGHLHMFNIFVLANQSIKQFQRILTEDGELLLQTLDSLLQRRRTIGLVFIFLFKRLQLYFYMGEVLSISIQHFHLVIIDDLLDFGVQIIDPSVQFQVPLVYFLGVFSILIRDG